MSRARSSGATEQEMRRVLAHELERRQIAEANALALSALRQRQAGSGRAPGFALESANALALGPSAGQIARAFMADLTVSYGRITIVVVDDNLVGTVLFTA